MNNTNITKHAVNRLIALLFIVVFVFAGMVSCGKTAEKGEKSVMKLTNVTDNGVKLAISELAATENSSALASYMISATVEPVDASNVTLDWDLKWASDAKLKSEDISKYLTVTKFGNTDKSVYINCFAAFRDSKAILTATARGTDIKGTCDILFVGKATSMDISTKAVKKTSTERGEYYEVYPKRTFTFDIALSNVFNSVQDPEYALTTGGEGEVYFGTEYASADTTNFGDFEKIALNDLASKFITSATITDNTLTVKTGDMKLEDFYESSVSDGYGTTYYKHYVYEDEFDLIADNEFKAKSAENVNLIKSAYFYINIKDKTSGLEKKIKLFFVDAPAAKLSVTSDLTSATTTERGEFYTLEPKKSYTFNIVTENIETPSLTVSVSGSGSAYFGTEVASSEITSFSDIAKKQISTIADKFITSAKIENGKLIITTGDKTLEDYYAASSSDGYSTTYTDRYVFYDEYGTTYGTDYEAKSTENQTLIKSCYFSVRIYDSSSRASKTIRFFM